MKLTRAQNEQRRQSRERTKEFRRQRRDPRILDVQQVADFLGLSVGVVYAMINRKEIAATRCGGQYRIWKPALEAQLAALPTQGNDWDANAK